MLDCREEYINDCNSCYELSIIECDDIVINLSLTPSDVYYVNIIDQFNLVRKQQATIDLNGSFTINLESLPENFFNRFQGKYEIILSNDEDMQDIKSFMIDDIEYSCILLSIV